MSRIMEYVKAMVDRVVFLLSDDTFAYSIWHSSLLMVLWGIWMMLPFDIAASVEAYVTLGQFASPFTWGAIAFVIGVSRMHFITTHKKISVGLMSLIAGYVWTIVGIAFLVGNVANTGGIVYLMLGLYDFYVYKKVSQ